MASVRVRVRIYRCIHTEPEGEMEVADSDKNGATPNSSVRTAAQPGWALSVVGA